MPAQVPTADELAAALADVRGVQSTQAQAIAALSARVGVLEGVEPDPDPDPDPPAGWPKGGSENTNKGSALADWGRSFGYMPTTGTVYLTRAAGWEGLIASASHTGPGQLGAHTDKSLTLVVQAPPFPDATPWNYADLVAGKYRPYWVRVGQAFAAREAAGFKPLVFSPLWEANGSYMRWGGLPQPAGQTGHFTSPDQFRKAFREVGSAVRSANPGQRICECFNAHGTPASIGATNPMDLYAGDDVVDELGIDCYDMYPPSKDDAAFDRQANAVGGILWFAGQARAHGKKLRVPEWGVNGNPKDIAAGNGGGDNPLFIRRMFAVFGQLHAAGELAGEFYFADPLGGANVDSTLLGGANPKAAAEYRRLWSA